MQDHLEINDDDFELKFSNCELDPSIFNHEAHLRLAWIHVNKYGINTALENIENQLKRFITHVGASDKYHHTLTIVAIRAVHHFMQRSTTHTFDDFISEFPELKSNFKGLVNSHYTFDIFSSEESRTAFIKPDLQPFE